MQINVLYLYMKFLLVTVLCHFVKVIGLRVTKLP